jgi:hypothetical protein
MKLMNVIAQPKEIWKIWKDTLVAKFNDVCYTEKWILTFEIKYYHAYAYYSQFVIEEKNDLETLKMAARADRILVQAEIGFCL